jgi:hypothetical protein
MSKGTLYLIVAIAVAVTAGTFFVAKDGHRVACTPIIRATDTDLSSNTFGSSDDQPLSLTPTNRGYPFGYYQDPLSATTSCIPNKTSSGFNTAHLAYDLLIWLGAATLLFLPSALFRWWRGPAMLGDNVRRR